MAAMLCCRAAWRMGARRARQPFGKTDLGRLVRRRASRHSHGRHPELPQPRPETVLDPERRFRPAPRLGAQGPSAALAPRPGHEARRHGRGVLRLSRAHRRPSRTVLDRRLARLAHHLRRGRRGGRPGGSPWRVDDVRRETESTRCFVPSCRRRSTSQPCTGRMGLPQEKSARTLASRPPPFATGSSDATRKANLSACERHTR